MKKPTTIIHHHLLTTTIFILTLTTPLTTPKSTIEPCSTNDSCTSLLGYTLYTDLKVSELASLFQIDPYALLSSNSIDFTQSSNDVVSHILPSQLFLQIPITCSCTDGIRKSVSTHYKTRPSDTLSNIADSVFGGLVSADQIKEANDVDEDVGSVIDVGKNLVVPLPCTCFNGTDNNVPAVYLSYVVKNVDTLAGIAARYKTTVTDLMGVNALGNAAIEEGDILAIPLSACASNFPRYASDYALSVPNGAYAVTADHCVECSCTAGGRLYCQPASLSVSCSSMQCKGSNLMLGNVTAQQTSAGCNVTSCGYGGFVNGTIITALSNSLQPRCPGPQQVPPLMPPPTMVSPNMGYAPAPSPFQLGGAPMGGLPGSTIPSTGSSIVLPPASGPSLSFSAACTLVTPLSSFSLAIALALFVKVAHPFL
uniref:lysM domain-containing GPI-anchored protein 1-like n=1 Tax=Erigeron canadensis TaxID=72917 RepID=UPI001CB98322|nr:lysM domain-containing GPI-anchored protein 1-like [Erigeron canadensis]